jgi:hypothetical protein
MAVNSLLVGRTYSLNYDFRDYLGALTTVDNPVVNLYTPQKELYLNEVALTTTDITGTYRLNFFAPVGLTIGHWSSIALGITQNSTIFSEREVFEVIDVRLEPAWLSLEELRTFLSVDDDDRTGDTNLKQALQAAIELVEGHTHRHYGESRYTEIIEVTETDRVQLKHFPIVSIVGLTATYRTYPRNTQGQLSETLDGSQFSFHYRVDYTNGIIKLLDNSGYDMTYCSVLLSLDYTAGFVSVPEPVRSAALSIAAQLNALACTEGIESIRFSDMQMVADKKIFDGHIEELLRPYKNNFKI